MHKEDILVMIYHYYNGIIITLSYINMELYLIDPNAEIRNVLGAGIYMECTTPL